MIDTMVAGNGPVSHGAPRMGLHHEELRHESRCSERGHASVVRDPAVARG